MPVEHDPYTEGYDAAYNDSLLNCPYVAGTHNAAEWRAGYEHALDELADLEFLRR